MPHSFKTLQSLEPIDTGTLAHLDPIGDHIEAVVFDIYGTLLISSSGDIGCQSLKGNIAVKSFRNAGLEWQSNLNEEALGVAIISEYETQIKNWHQEAKEEGIPQPEVDIVIIWKKCLLALEASRGIRVTRPGHDEVDHRDLAMHFEVCNNAVYPMPDMEQTLSLLEKKGYLLGIVSNAQFFTPMVLNHFMETPLLDELPYFHEDLQVFSYRLGRAKPDRYLYDVLSEKLKALGLVPEKCLYIGNDMLNDIYPAHLVGFKTVLFAGDERSLRWRSDDPRCVDLKPGRIITSLNQIPEILGIQ